MTLRTLLLLHHYRLLFEGSTYLYNQLQKYLLLSECLIYTMLLLFLSSFSFNCMLFSIFTRQNTTITSLKCLWPTDLKGTDFATGLYVKSSMQHSWQRWLRTAVKCLGSKFGQKFFRSLSFWLTREFF